MKNLKFLLLTGIILSGCGNNTKKQDSSITTYTVTGKVVDGEISGATVFLDLNKDGDLDSTEPSTLTQSDGTYFLTLSKKDKEHQNYLNQTAPLIAYGGKDIRTNKDFEDYLMTMLNGKNIVNITPFTTLITQSLEEENSQKDLKSINKTNAEIVTDLADKIARIKKNLAELFRLNESILDKDPIALAKEGDYSLLNQSLQLHKSAKSMKKAMKGDAKELKKSILKSYRSLGRELKKLTRDTVKNKDEALLKALDTAMDDSQLFDVNLVEAVKQETKMIIININDFWKDKKEILTDKALTDLLKEGEVQISVDTIIPVITIIGESNVTLLQGTIYTDPGATASDDKDGDITSHIEVNNNVDINNVGNYRVLYDVKDSAKNKALTVIRTILVFSVPEVPTIETLHTSTASDTTNVVINGTIGSIVFVNGEEAGIISSTGTVSVDLNTSGVSGDKNFTIILRDRRGNSSEALNITINRISITRAQALKFLRQASFRTNEAEIEYVMTNGYEAWIDNQFAMVGDTDSDTDTKYDYLESTLRTMNRYNPTAYPLSVATDPTTLNEDIIDGQRMGVFRNSVFWDKALNDENQLRQRVTYALSQILVVADISPVGKALSFRGESVINYYDTLYKHSFGNYRNLLTDVTHSSTMGYFLTYIGSRAKAPDENYARELTQLFTVGLYELNDDGTKQLSGGNPIPAYDQQHVTDLSKVFTGWGLDDLQGTDPRYGSTAKTDFSWVSPLKFFPEYHDNNSTLDLLGSATMSTSPDGSADIENALSILFANHNVAPYISRHLIMRLVTSNPTPAYVGRVAAKFNNNGAGVKGDLKAVVKAILLDPEARGETVVANFGKVDEMFVSMAHFLSQFKARPAPTMSVRVRVGFGEFESRDITNIYWINHSEEFGQTILGAPSVFNFYSNEFIPSSSYFAQNSLVAPELELQNISNLINYSNLIGNLLTIKEKYTLTENRTIEEWADAWNLTMSTTALYLDLTEEYNVFERALDNEAVANRDFANMGNGTGSNDDRTRAVNALLEHLDNKLLGGTMPQTYKDALLLHTESFDYYANTRSRALRAKAIVPTLVRAIVTSPLFMVLK